MSARWEARLSSDASPRLPTGKLLQALAMDTAVVIAGVCLFLETGQIAWMIGALIGSGAITFFMLAKPLMDAAKRGDTHVD